MVTQFLSAVAVGGTEVQFIQGTGDLVRGAIGGAFVIGLAFMAGMAVIKRSAVALFALVMMILAATLEMSWLGLVTAPPMPMQNLLLAAFAASVLIFLSSSMTSARTSPALSGGLFVAAAILIGLGVAQLFGILTEMPILRWVLMATAAGVAGLSVFQGVRGDHSAQFLIPGILIALAAPAANLLLGAGVGWMSTHALFTFGVIASCLVALIDMRTSGASTTAVPSSTFGLDDVAPVSFSGDRDSAAQLHDSTPAGMNPISMSNDQLAQVLDYTGVGMFDWREDQIELTQGFTELTGIQTQDGFMPHDLMNAFHKNARAALEGQLLATRLGDGKFDLVAEAQNGKAVRLRGARAVDAGGKLERLVIFAERAPATEPSLFSAPVAQPTAVASERHIDAPNILEALRAGQMEAAFQPIVSLDDRSVRGYEALLRAKASATGFDQLGAQDIVTAAQQQGVGGELAGLMLEASAQYLSNKLAQGKPKHSIFVAFNTSFQQLCAPGFVDKIVDTVKARNLPAKALVIELTEADKIDNEAMATDIFDQLTKAGVALAFDDFGAGFSCLGNLHKYSFNYLKLDKSFIESLGADDGSAGKIVTALSGLGKDLGMDVIAEGVSSQQIAEAAKNCGCVLAQGYLFGEAERRRDEVAPSADEASQSDQPAPSKRQFVGTASEDRTNQPFKTKNLR